MKYTNAKRTLIDMYGALRSWHRDGMTQKSSKVIYVLLDELEVMTHMSDEDADAAVQVFLDKRIPDTIRAGLPKDGNSMLFRFEGGFRARLELMPLW